MPPPYRNNTSFYTELAKAKKTRKLEAVAIKEEALCDQEKQLVIQQKLQPSRLNNARQRHGLNQTALLLKGAVF
ncbi:hypothetical protein [Oceanobacter antarcticus]|uniref:Transposase n=1 Tax=Oceanobacter antarcticus TaxID=3133425 RepID=A0ABW8NIQ3_9GAMM